MCYTSYMGAGPTKFTLRLTDDAAANLDMVVRRDGLTKRSAIEAAVELATLFCGDADRRQKLVPHLEPVALERAVEAAWVACYQLAARHNTSREHRVEVDVRLDSEWVADLKACSAKRHLPLNATVACVFTPWGSGWCPLGDPAYDARLALWTWAAQRARERDYERRSRRSTEAPAAPAVHVAGM